MCRGLLSEDLSRQSASSIRYQTGKGHALGGDPPNPESLRFRSVDTHNGLYVSRRGSPGKWPNCRPYRSCLRRGSCRAQYPVIDAYAKVEDAGFDPRDETWRRSDDVRGSKPERTWAVPARTGSSTPATRTRRPLDSSRAGNILSRQYVTGT